MLFYNRIRLNSNKAHDNILYHALYLCYKSNMVDVEISEAGREARFAQWEKLGLDRVKADLLSGGHGIVGGPPAVRNLAWEWVRSKEAALSKGGILRRDPELIRKLLLKLEDYPSQLGDVFVFGGQEPELAVEGYSSDQITYHLEQLKAMGLIDSPGSQPMLGVTFAGLSAQGHDVLERYREQSTGAASLRMQPEAAQSPAKPPTYARETVIAAANMLKALGHSGFEEFLLELDLPSEVGTGDGLLARATSLAKFSLDNPTRLTPERRTVPYEMIRRATDLWRQETENNLRPQDRQKFENAMKRDGQEAALRHGHDGATMIALAGSGSLTIPSSPTENQGVAMSPATVAARKVFIVHGHDDGAREAIARFLERIGFEAIILHEQANKGRTVIEKFVANSDVGFVVVLLTPDDTGAKAGAAQAHRARQNVILEWGYFIGKLGRERVCALKKGDVELPSDILGIVWEPLDEHGAWKGKLAKELEGADFAIDWTKVH